MTKSLPLSLWLGACCVCLILMVLLGGVTRLTSSGLSIVEWKPVVGTLPPLSEAAWQSEFAAYQKTPEYQKINQGMSLEAFQSIYLMEYGHRLMGRLTGIVVLLPLLYFCLKRMIPARIGRRMMLVFLLGGLQGAIGWFMVQSGLKDQPDVSHYRLALHLMTALVIYSLVFWTLLEVSVTPGRVLVSRSFQRHTVVALGMLFLQILTGAFVAGLDAGLVYNTFPLMGGRWVPLEWGTLSPWHHDLFENPVSVQFIHRIGAWLTWVVIVLLVIRSLRMNSTPFFQKTSLLLLAVAFLQPTLGILTLQHHVPVLLGSLHQLGAVLLLSCILLHRYQLSSR